MTVLLYSINSKCAVSFYLTCIVWYWDLFNDQEASWEKKMFHIKREQHRARPFWIGRPGGVVDD